MFRRPSRNELIEMCIVAVVGVPVVLGLRSGVLTTTQFAFFAWAYLMWLVWCGVAGWRKWSQRRKLVSQR
jgi:hypothetical protein